MTLGTFAAKGQAAIADPTGARAAVIAAVQDLSDAHPRTLQRTLGPSEVGEPCARQIAFKLMNTEPSPGRRIDPWPSFLGIAAHARIDLALQRQNLQQPGTWLTERRVTIPGVRDGGNGTSDAYYAPTFTTIDWKVLGDTTFTELRSLKLEGHRKYRAQGHIYGLGWAAMGLRVDWVALGIFGRSKPLSAMYVLAEPFDPAYAASELHRVADIRKVVDWLKASGTSDVALVPPAPGKGCYYCPYRGAAKEGYCEE